MPKKVPWPVIFSVLWLFLRSALVQGPIVVGTVGMALLLALMGLVGLSCGWLARRFGDAPESSWVGIAIVSVADVAVMTILTWLAIVRGESLLGELIGPSFVSLGAMHVLEVAATFIGMLAGSAIAATVGTALGLRLYKG